jgi:hypothetical protein
LRVQHNTEHGSAAGFRSVHSIHYADRCSCSVACTLYMQMVSAHTHVPIQTTWCIHQNQALIHQRDNTTNKRSIPSMLTTPTTSTTDAPL